MPAAPGPAPLTVQEAVALGLGHSSAAERARHEREAGRAAAQRDAPRFAPALSLTGAGLLNSPEITFPRGTSGEAVVVPNSRARLEVTAQTPVFRVGAAGAARRSRASASAADLGLAQALVDVRRAVKRAYYALAAADAGLGLAREGLEQARAHRRLVDDLVQAGQAARIDQLQADVEVEDAATAAADASDARDLAAAELLRVMGRRAESLPGPGADMAPPESRLDRLRELSPEVVRLTPPTDEPAPEPDEPAARAAVERRPDLRALAAQVEAAEAGARLARAQMAPSIDLLVGYALQTPSAFIARSSWNAGLTLTLPLGTRPQASADAREATARAAAARAALDELREGAVLEVRQALSVIRAARRRRASAGRAVTAADEALRITELRFQAGQATSLEVNAARSTLQRHRLDQLRGLYDWYSALADLERATGVPLPGVDGGR
jgi:outer membrane protein TolC